MQAGKYQRGLGYLFALILVAIVSVTSLWSIRIGDTIRRQDAESELLRVGNEFAKALQSYRFLAGRDSSGPESLKELLLDPRFPLKGRHLRKIYYDPLTGTDDWGLILAPDKKIIGVFSKSADKPIMQLKLSHRDSEYALKYSQWIFGATDAWYAEQGLSKPCRCNRVGAEDADFVAFH